MNIFLLITIISGSLLVCLILLGEREKSQKNNEDQDDSDEEINAYKGLVYSKCLLTETEKRYYHKLKELIPDHVMVHTQISFNSFLKCEHIDIRNRYNRGVVDMVITDLDFNVLVLVEIDDDSHTAKRIKQKDQVRDEITSGAGIPTIRIDDSFSDNQIARILKKYYPRRARKKAVA